MGNLIQFQKFQDMDFLGPHPESGYELKRRILNEFKLRGRKRPGRKPTGRVTFYMIETLIREGRKNEADALAPYVTTQRKAKDSTHPEIEYASEKTPENRYWKRYRARKEREREARDLLRGQSEKARAERNEMVRFQISGHILERVDEIGKESGLSVGEMCRVFLASIAGANFVPKLEEAQKIYPWWKLNGKI